MCDLRQVQSLLLHHPPPLNYNLIINQYSSLKTSHASHPLTWDSLARREWTDVDTSLLDGKQLPCIATITSSRIIIIVV